MSLLIVYAPDEGAEQLARALDGPCLGLAEVSEAALRAAGAIILVTPDYYTHACWELKRWLCRNEAALARRLCSCVVLSQHDGGGELAMRTVVSQLLRYACPVYLCAALCPDGLLRPGASGEALEAGLLPKVYCAEISKMAQFFG